MVGDGYVGMNVNPRVPGRGGRLEHFGFEVTTRKMALDRLRKYPDVDWLKRPSNRPYAGISAHDPDGNVFDISQREDGEPHGHLCRAERQGNPRHISHFGLRTMRPTRWPNSIATSSSSSRATRRGRSQPLSHRRHMTMVIMPWKIKDYDATGIMPPSLDHMGFKVESLEKFKADSSDQKPQSSISRPSPSITARK